MYDKKGFFFFKIVRQDEKKNTLGTRKHHTMRRIPDNIVDKECLIKYRTPYSNMIRSHSEYISLISRVEQF